MHRSTTLAEAKKSLTVKEKVGQLFMPAAFINDSEEEIQQLEQLIREQGIGGLCFFHSRASAATNFEGKKEVIKNEESFRTLQNLIIRYQKAAKHPLLMAIDAEWGLAMRVERTPQYPYAITLGAIQGNDELIFEVGQHIAQDCKAAGLHWNLSPVVDLNSDPNNPVIGYRSFGDDKLKVFEKADAYIRGMESEGVLSSIKHFPGHGDTATDSHLGLPLIDKSKDELFQNELYPFQKLIDSGVDSVMIGHLSVPSLTSNATRPSSINKNIIKGVLRQEMGFTGVVISDALNMHAVSKNYPGPGELEWLAFDAGNDILCFAEHIPEGVKTILSRATPHQVEESFERIWQLKEKAMKAQVPEFNPNSGLSSVNGLNRKLAEHSLTLFKGTETKITKFRNTDHYTLSIKRQDKNEPVPHILKTLKRIRSEVIDQENIRLLLTPPRVKPANNFGFLKAEIDFINEIISKKKVVLYHFGNPYALQLFKIENTWATVIAYQGFPEFHEVAEQHFMGHVQAIGKLPVSLKQNER
ncbi:glycoside hydrolase family 3 protein [Maribacter sp. 2304DJ31-5]|uniref:glycoside hydrolase family 3 protein n=1 Tax=Maribacter sp. 2304DJ31-5 TaxID=3386273 RepID=UPI0039BC237D